MQAFALKFRALACAICFAVLVFTTSAPASADALVEYFAESMTRGPSGPTYGDLRQEFFTKIENARSAANACSGCADAQAELDALLEEEEQYQRMAGRALTMTGQPPAVFRMLGIRQPDFVDYAASFPSTYESGEGLVNTGPGKYAVSVKLEKK